ncbi:hypothetical protein B0I33_1132 [Prauserella shujinwangii]|uniref:DUF2637 domain-containing protein n=1 Tax=Prauserella shujinwangii TaxID=1453103 RepID=A0A2T0LLD0_9PSEU|nr:hypothetical protein [Prauserella shujinwangii]PRX43839.1 hypothetical protein B0I33_1132 [Prauserella shujinwangii]
MSTWRDERRKDRAAEAEQKRADRLAAAEAEAVRLAALSEANRAATEQAHAHEQAREQARRTAKQQRAQRRRAMLAGLRAWAGTHAVDLLIYPLALVSAVMAVPAMAAYGHDAYGGATGYVLPVLSELGMWAFAVAVQVSRARFPQRPVWALQLGVWLFAGVAFVLNFLHGLTTPSGGVDIAVVMGLVSVAGVLAHQLITAGARRSRAERDAARIDRRAARKVAAVRKAAVRQAVAEIDPDGTARLVYAPGRYVLARRQLGRRRELQAAIVPGLPVDPVVDGELDALDRELAALLDADHPTTPGTTIAEAIDHADHATDEGGDSGGVATLDRGADQRESRVNRGLIEPPPARSMEQLRAELATAVEAGRVDPTSAESIRKGLRCSAARARQLRDEHRTGEDQ